MVVKQTWDLSEIRNVLAEDARDTHRMMNRATDTNERRRMRLLLYFIIAMGQPGAPFARRKERRQ